jgi:F-type H+-transporting ATPase subunit gamma
MSESVETLRKKIEKAKILGSFVRTMKTLASLNIRQYEESVRALVDYYHTVELGLAGVMRSGYRKYFELPSEEKKRLLTVAVVFGSDQGLVGQFNDQLVDAVRAKLPEATSNSRFLIVGEQVRLRMMEMDPGVFFGVPNSVNAITWLVGDLLVAIENLREQAGMIELCIFYNSPVAGGVYRSVSKRLLPFDESWEKETLDRCIWPTRTLPELPVGPEATQWALVREYLFVSMFRACAESLASENASRLEAMQRADRNIDEMLEELSRSYHERRQAKIDEELFDLVSGFNALTGKS